MNTQKGEKRALFKKFSTLHDAMEWMIRKGSKKVAPTTDSDSSPSDEEDTEQLLGSVTAGIAGLDIHPQAGSNSGSLTTPLASASTAGGVGAATKGEDNVVSRDETRPPRPRDTHGTTRPTMTETHEDVPQQEAGVSNISQVPGTSRLGVSSISRTHLRSIGAAKYCYVRGTDGLILRNIWRYNTKKSFHPLSVPSLGPVVDSFLDAFGYDSELANILYENWMSSDNGEVFANKIQPWVPLSKAFWYWQHIRVSTPPTVRVRNLP